MAIQNWNSSQWGRQPLVRVFYPDGCLADTEYLVSNQKIHYSGSKYVRESRPYPGQDQLLNQLTPRERVETTRGEYGDQYYVVSELCPHSGSHGRVLTEVHYAAVSAYGKLYDDTSFIAQKQWANAIRRKLEKNRVNLASSVAEYRESTKLFVAVAKSLFGAYRDIRHGRWPKFMRRNIGDIPASILQYNFGVAPLVGDLFSVVEALRLRLTDSYTIRTSTSVKHPIETVKTIGEFEYEMKGSIRQRATIYYDMDPTQYVSDQFSFGNPIEWAWELIPFSFVVDWALPVGSYLSGLDALTGITNIRGTVVTKNDQRWTGIWNKAEVIVSPHNGYYRSYQREVISSVPAPLPRWTPSPSYMKLLNASSILATMRLNRFPKIKFLR